jgi:hypothetical protein
MTSGLKRLLVPALTGALVAGALVVPATAKKPKPVDTVLYMHGDSVVGEADSSPQVADVPLKMDANPPTAQEPKSHGIANAVVTPNSQCAGNNLFPVFVGDLKGRIVGDMTLGLQFLSTPGQVDVRVWTDKFGLLCNSNVSGSAEYPEPAAEATVDLPFGQAGVEVVLHDLDVVATTNLMVQVSPTVAATVPTPAGDESVYAPFLARLVYDSTLFSSQVQFSCIPPKGAKSCTP